MFFCFFTCYKTLQIHLISIKSAFFNLFIKFQYKKEVFKKIYNYHLGFGCFIFNSDFGEMGCASSKQKRCRHCKSPYSPVSRSYSMHVHHPPQTKGDSYHVVALRSSTLGSLKLDFKNQSSLVDIDLDADHHQQHDDDQKVSDNQCNGDLLDKFDKSKSKSEEFSTGLIRAKEWSNMIEEKIPKVVPKTPVRTPPGEPETINAWEMMEGLEDVSPLRSPNHFRSFSFDVARGPSSLLDSDPPMSKLCEDVSAERKTMSMWLQMANGDDHGDSESNSKPFALEFDPDVIKTFRKSFQELSPRHPFHLRPLENDKLPAALDSLDVKKSNGAVLDHNCGKEKLVVYFTSLRGIRKTFEDCCHVRVILKGLGVRVDERDLSMHSGFKNELKELLGDGFSGGGLPRVFVGKMYIGGAEEIRRMHEEGQLEKVVEGCEMIDDGGRGNVGACEACGDVRFVPCETCSGSCKIYYEKEEEVEEDSEGGWVGEEADFGFQRCPDCNENGLTRCPICCF